MSKGMTTCKVCSHELAKSAKRCPHCGAKNRQPIYKKWWFWLFIAIVLYLAVDIITARMEAKKANQREVEEYNYLDYEYTDVAIQDMLTALDRNLLQAESKYVGQYIKFSGYVDDYITSPDPCSPLYESADNKMPCSSFFVIDTIHRVGLWCELNPLLQPIEYNREKITIWGKVLSARDEYDAFKYEIEVLYYEFDQATPTDKIVFTDYTANDLIAEYYNSDKESAEEKLYNQYVTITAPLWKVEKDHIEFVESGNGTFIVGSGWITCPLLSDAQKDLIAHTDFGDTLAVKGRVAYMSAGSGAVFIEIETMDIAQVE